ncbi:MAG: SURF1 family cytochrome oxidase biogenesis protein [Litorimonas sp.]
MNLKFQPMPWLTGIVAVMLAILISLGVWQYQRLQWKTDLLAEVEASVTAPPLTSLADLERAIEAGEPVDFRRIKFQAPQLTGAPIYAVYKSQAGDIYWDLFTQYAYIFARFDTVVEADKPLQTKVCCTSSIAPFHIGYVREDHPMGRVESWIKSKPNPVTNRWFKFNQSGDWGVGEEVRTSHYIDIEKSFVSVDDGEPDANVLPIRRPTIRNNHRDYMLTWFSFAGLLLIFYLLIHKRAGRLSW